MLRPSLSWLAAAAPLRFGRTSAFKIKPLPPDLLPRLFLFQDTRFDRAAPTGAEYVHATDVQTRSRRKPCQRGGARLWHRLRLRRREADRITAAVLSRLCRGRHTPRCLSSRPRQSAHKTCGRNIVLAARSQRCGCLCIGGLVSIAGSSADLALPGRTFERPGAKIVRRRTRGPG